MGLFSRGPSIEETFGYAVQAFGTGVLNLDDKSRSNISSVAVGSIKGYLSSQSFSDEEKNSILTMFQIVSGTVGVKPSAQINTYGKAQEISEMIESTLPFNMPIVVLGPIRMVIEEYITGKKMSEIDYDKFDKSDARQIVHALMKGIEIVNTRCIQDPRKHPKNEVMCFAYLAAVVAEYAKEQLKK